MREVLDLNKFRKAKRGERGGSVNFNNFGLLVLGTKRSNIAAEKNYKITS